MNKKMKSKVKHAALLLLSIALITSCMQKGTEKIPLKDAFKDYFYI